MRFTFISFFGKNKIYIRVVCCVCVCRAINLFLEYLIIEKKKKENLYLDITKKRKGRNGYLLSPSRDEQQINDFYCQSDSKTGLFAKFTYNSKIKS